VRLGKAVPFLGACLGIRARHEEHVHQSHVPALGSEVERAEPAAWHGIRVAAPLEQPLRRIVSFVGARRMEGSGAVASDGLVRSQGLREHFQDGHVVLGCRLNASVWRGQAQAGIN
jgi:hypothetical protein